MDSWTRVFFADGQGRRHVKPLTSCRVSSDVERPWNAFILSESLALNGSLDLALRANKTTLGTAIATTDVVLKVCLKGIVIDGLRMRYPRHDPHLRLTPIVSPGTTDDDVDCESDEKLGKRYVRIQVQMFGIEPWILTNENVRPIRITSMRTMVRRQPMTKEVIVGIDACRCGRVLSSKGC